MVETFLRLVRRDSPPHQRLLRYFNASGGDPEGRLGEEHEPETHLIPAAAARRADWPAGHHIRRRLRHPRRHLHPRLHSRGRSGPGHILALDHLLGGGASGSSMSVPEAATACSEMLRVVEEVTGRPVPLRDGPRREGDPPRLVASPAKLRATLGWEPRYAGLRTIVEHAWKFASKQGG